VVPGSASNPGSVPEAAGPAPPAPARLLRIHEAAAEIGLTTRSIRYYEELGLLAPAARSEGDYRLYDQDDLERLRYIKGLRDDAGFSLAEIAQLLEDEAARARNRARFRRSHDPIERRAIVQDALARVDRQVTTLRAKAERIEAMIADATARRAHLTAHLAEIEAEMAGDRKTAAERHVEAHAGASDATGVTPTAEPHVEAHAGASDATGAPGDNGQPARRPARRSRS
jgi:DNA-binding transcriptional MerR regulator